MEEPTDVCSLLCHFVRFGFWSLSALRCSQKEHAALVLSPALVLAHRKSPHKNQTEKEVKLEKVRQYLQNWRQREAATYSLVTER